MTVAQFRRLALSMPEASESAHMEHPDFRVAGKIFATLLTRDDAELGMVKLTSDQQRRFVALDSDAFAPIPGAWGRRGATEVRLASANQADVRDALAAAWRNTAPKRLLRATEPDA